jgi:hypothetical protein
MPVETSSTLGNALTTLFSTMAPKLTMSTRAYMRVAVHLTGKRPPTLYHYTTAAGFQGILENARCGPRISAT